ncbi:MAG: chromosomal replication initiator protein DnaA [Nitrospirota bacterium]
MKASLDDIWQQSLPLMKGEVGESVFDLWLSPVRLVHMKDGAATVEVPNRFYKEWIEDYHPDLIRGVLSRVTESEVNVKYRVAAREDASVKKLDARLENRKTKLARKGIYLNPRYTFDTFVVGPSNQIAHAAAMAVADDPGKLYNPLFVYGGVGLGKTHLVTAIGNRAVDRFRDLNVLYVSAEQFTTEVVSAFRHNKAEELKNKYRNLDVFLIDDVQYVEGKDYTQEELFHTINALYERQKQIVLSSDRPPREIRSVTDRLRSRFSMGLTADIQLPGFELRVGIIQKKAAENAIAIPQDVVELLASKVTTNIRDMEGCLIRLGAHSSLTGSPISVEMAKDVLKDMIQEADRPITVEVIIKAVAEHFGLKPQELKARKRTRGIAQPRQLAMFLARELTDLSLSDIGKQTGGKDHATVIYACKQIEKRCGADENFERMVDTLRNKIKA